MQTFLPEYSFTQSARALDYRRLGKQRVECLQLLGAMTKGPMSIKIKNGVERQVKTPWYNHPAGTMWHGWEMCLIRYGQIICEEWKRRGYRDTCYEKITAFIPQLRSPHQIEKYSMEYCIASTCGELSEHEKIDAIRHPPWYGKSIVESHRSNLIRKNANIYKSKWPETVEGLEYWWPTEHSLHNE